MTEYEVANDKVFDEITTWLGRVSSHHKIIDGHLTYFIDTQKEPFARVRGDSLSIEVLTDEVPLRLGNLKVKNYIESLIEPIKEESGDLV